MNKKTNKQAADALFASTAHDTLWANPRGEFFTSENTGSLSLTTGEKLEKFERPAKEASTQEKEYELNAKDTIAKIKATTSLEGLKTFDSDERKSVIVVYEAKKAELTAAIQVTGTTTETADGNADTDTQK